MIISPGKHRPQGPWDPNEKKKYVDLREAWLWLPLLALVGGVIAVTTFFAALALLGPSDTAVISTVEPVVSIAVAALVLGERLVAVQVVGGVVVLAAVAVLARLKPVEADAPVPA